MSGGNLLDRSRRALLKKLGLIGTAGTTAGAGVALLSKPAFAIQAGSFSADAVSIVSNAGEVQDVYVQPQSLSYSWDGLDTDPSDVTFEVFVDTPSTNGTGNTDTGIGSMASLGSESDPDITSGSTEGLEGSDSYSFGSQLSLIGDGPWTKQDFQNPNNDGSTRTVAAIEVVVQGTLTTTDGATYTHARRAQFDVDVTNQGPTFTGTGGSAGTGGSTPGN